MTTALEIVTRAYRKAGISASNEPLTAEMGAEGIEALNDMIFGWKLRGVDVTHVALALADTFALGAEYVEGTVYLLASRLSPNYSLPPAFDADDWFRGIQATYTAVTPVVLPKALIWMPSQRTRRGFY